MAMPGLVQTSTNLARVVSDGKTVKLQCLLRSSVGTEKEALGEAIAAELRAAGVRIGATTGYTDKMMAIVAPAARERGYAPDFSITPDATHGKGRPWPYMVFRNLEALGVSSVQAAAKVGDTASDMREGKAAGVFTIGVIEGSSELGLAQEEYEALSPAERDRARDRVEARFRAAGADAVVRTLAELPQLLRQER